MSGPKLLVILTAVAGIALVTVERLPASVVGSFDHVPAKFVLSLFAVFLAADLGMTIYVHFAELSSTKYIRQLTAIFATLTFTSLAVPWGILSFQEANIRANIDQRLGKNGVDPVSLKADIEASIKMAKTDSLRDVVPLVAIGAGGLVLCMLLYIYAADIKQSNLDDARRRKKPRRSSHGGS